MKPLIEIANQICQIEKKSEKDENSANYSRHIQRIKTSLLELGISYHNPEGEKYLDTRTDIEANITGEISADMRITQTIKPIVFHNGKIAQVGVVIVESI